MIRGICFDASPMPLPAHAADLERVLSRAAEECESKIAWFGEGLPQLLRRALSRQAIDAAKLSPEVAFVEVSAVSAQGRTRVSEPVPNAALPVIGLSSSGLEGLSSLIGSAGANGIGLARLICPVAVFDFTPDGLRVREIKHGLTAVDLQRQLSIPLWSGPDLKELGAH